MSHPSVNCAHQLPSMGANKPLLEEMCHAVTEWWLFYFLVTVQKGRPMVAPTNNDYSVFFNIQSTVCHKKGDRWSPLRTVVIPIFISEVLFNSKGRPMISPTNSIFLNYRLQKKATGGRPYNQSFFLNVNIFINTNVTGTPIMAAIA